jgi:ribonuclease E
VSRKIEDEEERRRLRQILDSLKPPKDVGFIIRTAGVGRSKLEIERDLKYLTRLWENFQKQQASGPVPMELYREGDLVTRTVRDVFTSDVERIVIDNKDVAKRVKDFIKLAMPRTRNKVELYEEPVPLFHKYGIEKEIELMYSRHVPLPSGGSLVIDSTEAIVAIDVNSGKFREHSDAEMTAFKTDMEAADEIPRQLKLRDLGGVIICDFIDLRYERHRRELEKRLDQNFRRDRAKTKVLRMSQFGIIEMTRQRMRPSLKRSIYFDCPHCKGAGLVKTPESMSLDVMRRMAIALNDQRVQRVELGVCPDVAFYLQNKKRQQLAQLESITGKRLLIRSEPLLGLDQMRLDLYDTRDSLIIIEELSTFSEQPPHTTQLATRPANLPANQRQGRRGRNDRQQQGRPRPPQEETEAMDERPERHDQDQEEEETFEPREESQGREDEEYPEAQRSGGRDNSRRDAAQGRGRGGDQRDRNQRGGDSRGRHQGDRNQQGAEQRSGGGRRGEPRGEQRGGDQRGGENRSSAGRERGQVPADGRRPVEAGHSAQGPAYEAAPAGDRNGGRGGNQEGVERNGAAAQEGEGEGGGRRRRRRRGRRGRGGRGQGVQPQEPQMPQTLAERLAQAAAGDSEEAGEESYGGAAQSADAYVSDHNSTEDDQVGGEIEVGLDEVEVGFARPSETSNEPSPEEMAEEAEAVEVIEPAAKPPAKAPARSRSRRKAPAAEAAEEAVEAPAAEEEAPKKRAPRRRGGRRSGRASAKTDNAQAASEQAEAAPSAESALPAEPPARIAEEAIATARGGIADRHLVADEPVLPQPPRRPRTYRDLDEIPDDFD